MAMDKLREDFEEWYARKHPLKRPSVRRLKLWEAYRDSRESIVIDTPQLCGDGENDSEYTEGYNDGITATEKTILSIGLSIKGEGQCNG